MIVETSLRKLVLVALAPWLVAVSAAGLSPDSQWPTAIVVAAAATGLAGYALFAFTGRRGPLLSLLVLTCVGLGMASPRDLVLVGSPLIASWLNLTCFTLAALAVWRIAVPVGVATVATSIGLVAAGSVSGGGSRAASELAVIAMYALNDLAVVTVAATILRRTASEGDAAALGRARASALAASAESAQAELIRVFRLIHDTAMNTLGAVARLSSLDRSVVAGRCADDLEVLRAFDQRPRDEPASLLDSVRRRARLLGVALDLDAPELGPRLDHAVGEALEGAIWEALNNIAKHSGQRSAAVDWRWDGSRGRVAIMDSGRGFDAGINGAQGLGESIVARCAQAGVASRVISEPGAGTAVVLSWSGFAPHSEPVADASLPEDSSLEGVLAESVRAICVVFAVTGSLATSALPAGPARWGSVLSLLVVTGLALMAHLRMRGRSIVLAGWVYPVLAVIASWAPAMTLAGCGRSGSWNWGPLAGIGVASAAIMLDRRRWVLIATVCGYVLGNLQPIREVGPGFPACSQEALSVLVVDLAVILGILAYRRQLTRAWGIGQRQHEAMRADLAEAARAHRASETRRGLMDIALRVAEPVLAGLASGELDPDDPAVRGEAARAERILRSLAAIPVGDPGGAGSSLTDLVLAANDRGVALTLSLNAALDQDPSTVRRAAIMLAAALDACPSGSAAQITVLQAAGGLKGLVLIDVRALVMTVAPESVGPATGDPVSAGVAPASTGPQPQLAAMDRNLTAAGWTVTVVGDEVLAEATWEDPA